MSDYEQSMTACCPRETIPDSCSCLDGCACYCLDCDCGNDAAREAEDEFAALMFDADPSIAPKNWRKS